MVEAPTTHNFESGTFKLISNKIGVESAIGIAGMSQVDCADASEARTKISSDWEKQYSDDKEKMKGASVEMYHQFVALAVMLDCKPEHMKAVLEAVKDHFAEKASSSEKTPLFDRFVHALIAEADPKDFDANIKEDFRELFKIESSSSESEAADGPAVCELFRAFSLKVGSKGVDEKTAKELFESHFLIEKTKIIRSGIRKSAADKTDLRMVREGKQGYVSFILRKLLNNEDWKRSSLVYKILKLKQGVYNMFASAKNNPFYLQLVIFGLFAISSWVSYGRFQNVLVSKIFLVLASVMGASLGYSCGRAV